MPQQIPLVLKILTILSVQRVPGIQECPVVQCLPTVRSVRQDRFVLWVPMGLAPQMFLCLQTVQLAPGDLRVRAVLDFRPGRPDRDFLRILVDLRIPSRPTRPCCPGYLSTLEVPVHQDFPERLNYQDLLVGLENRPARLDRAAQVHQFGLCRQVDRLSLDRPMGPNRQMVLVGPVDPVGPVNRRVRFGRAVLLVRLVQCFHLFPYHRKLLAVPIVPESRIDL